MNVFQKIKAILRFDEAVQRAEQAHLKNGNRYYVVPSFASRGKLIVMDRFNFRKLKQKGYITRNALVHDLERECFYFTPYRNGSSAISTELKKLKRKQYLEWYASDIKKDKDGTLHC